MDDYGGSPLGYTLKYHSRSAICLLFDLHSLFPSYGKAPPIAVLSQKYLGFAIESVDQAGMTQVGA